MNTKLCLPNTERTGFQRLYQAVFKEPPNRDINEADLPYLLRVLDTLDPREKTVIQRYYGIGLEKAAMAAIGSEFDPPITRVQATLIRDKAVRKLSFAPRREMLFNLSLSRAELLAQSDCLSKQIHDLSKRELKPTGRALAIIEKDLATAAQMNNQAEEDEGMDGLERLLKSVPISKLGFSRDTQFRLVIYGITTLYHLVTDTSSVSYTKNISKKKRKEIENVLSEYGLTPQEGS